MKTCPFVSPEKHLLLLQKWSVTATMADRQEIQKLKLHKQEAKVSLALFDKQMSKLLTFSRTFNAKPAQPLALSSKDVSK